MQDGPLDARRSRRFPSVARTVHIVSGLGALSGYLLGAILGIGSSIATGRFEWRALLTSFLFAGPAGAVAGAFLAPLLGFVLLRHIPLWISILWTSIGTTLGFALAVYSAQPWWILGGFAAGGIGARVSTPRRLGAVRPPRVLED